MCCETFLIRKIYCSFHGRTKRGTFLMPTRVLTLRNGYGQTQLELFSLDTIVDMVMPSAVTFIGFLTIPKEVSKRIKFLLNLRQARNEPKSGLLSIF